MLCSSTAGPSKSISTVSYIILNPCRLCVYLDSDVDLPVGYEHRICAFRMYSRLYTLPLFLVPFSTLYCPDFQVRLPLFHTCLQHIFLQITGTSRSLYQSAKLCLWYLNLPWISLKGQMKVCVCQSTGCDYAN